MNDLRYHTGPGPAADPFGGAFTGRRVLLTVTRAGREVAVRRRTPRGEQLARGLSSGFTDDELEQLVEVAPLLGRLADLLS